MLGAMIGDIVGSVHEFPSGSPTKTKDFKFFTDQSHYTDDTVCTAAVADWLMIKEPDDPAYWLRKYVKQFPKCGYGGMFQKWAISDDMPAYNSWGNGSAMRVSAAGWLGKTGKEVITMATVSSLVTHNHPDAVKGARAAAIAIYLARKGKDKDTIRQLIRDAFGYKLDRTIDEIRPNYRFYVQSKYTVPPAIVCALEADSFEDTIRNAVSLGGDADTLAAIAGGIGEALYGIPEDIMREGLVRIPDEIRDVLKRFSITISSNEVITKAASSPRAEFGFTDEDKDAQSTIDPNLKNDKK